ncbi:MAG: SPOR domain-containing protein [Bacteroidota bacterium]
MKQAPNRTNPAAAQQPQRPQGSVLDKYPERDLSRLTVAGRTAPPDEAAGMHNDSAAASGTDQAKPQNSQNFQDTEYSADDGTTDIPTTAAEANMGASTNKGPLAAILGIVLLLVVLAFIWHVNPWPSLKDSIAGLFGSDSAKTSEQKVKSTRPAVAEEQAPQMRAWDFYLQVSSWKNLGQADLDAERYRAQNFDVFVESEFISNKGGTWYRVRLGPYESSFAARETLAKNAGVIPKDAYVDSIRLTQEQPVMPVSTPQPVKRDSRSSTSDAASITGSESNEGRARQDFEIIDQPMSGWAVKVSSLKTEDLARQEARKVLTQGYPSFITRKNISGTNWYRVLVGPFSEKSDADRYQQLLNVTYGNDAYTVNLAVD